MMVRSEKKESGWYRRYGKRLIDLLVGAVLLILLSPVFVLTAIAVWLALGRPVFFRQDRAGLGGHPFTLTKFRSMLPETVISGRDEERLTAFGRFIRRTSLDEIPELWHVIRGQMSLVGPRPLLLRYNDRYSVQQARRLSVRPGLTGWAQIHGRNDTTWNERLAHDVWYVDNLSLGLDATILLRTIPAVFTGSGASPEGESFMPEFEGASSDLQEHDLGDQ